MPSEALFFLIGVGVTATGWIIVHRFNRSRDREAREHADKTAKDARKRDFIGFMEKWRTEVERDDPRKTANAFSAKVSLFRGEAAKISLDYGVEFSELVRKLSSLRDGEVEEVSPDRTKMIGRDRLLGAIDAVVNFVRTN